jgi:hypothetical protein
LIWGDSRRNASLPACTEAPNLRLIYDWFTEGFDTSVLQEAKALLDELV